MQSVNPVFGPEHVATFVLWLFDMARRRRITVERVLVNGGPGLITRDEEGKIVTVLSLEVLDGSIHTVRGIVNPGSSRISVLSRSWRASTPRRSPKCAID